MRKVSDMLGPALGRDEVLRAARAQRAMHEWSDIVGPMLAERSWPDKYERGTVWVAVSGSAWAQELRMIKDLILRRLREKAGSDAMFVDVRFGVRPLPSAPEKIEEVQTPKEVVDLTGFSIREIAERRLQSWKHEGGT